MALRFLITFLLLAPLSRADDLQVEAALNASVGLSRKWDVTLRTRARIRPSEREVADASIIPVFGYQAHRNVLLYFGNYFTRRNLRGVGTSTVFRPVAGIEPVLVRERFSVEFRTGYERLVVLRAQDFNRYRQRVRVIGNSSWAPSAGVELFFTNEGHTKTRYAAGVERKIGDNHSVEFGYRFERRELLENRHMIFATFNLNFKGLAPDF